MATPRPPETLTYIFQRWPTETYRPVMCHRPGQVVRTEQLHQLPGGDGVVSLTETHHRIHHGACSNLRICHTETSRITAAKPVGQERCRSGAVSVRVGVWSGVLSGLGRCLVRCDVGIGAVSVRGGIGQGRCRSWSVSSHGGFRQNRGLPPDSLSPKEERRVCRTFRPSPSRW